MKFLDIDFLLIQYVLKLVDVSFFSGQFGWQLVEPFDGGGEFQL